MEKSGIKLGRRNAANLSMSTLQNKEEEMDACMISTKDVDLGGVFFVYGIPRNPLSQVSRPRWPIFLPLCSIHGDVYHCVDIQIRYNTIH